MFSIDLLLARVAARDGLLERVEVHAHEVDLLDLLLGRRAQVLVVVAPREQAGVQPRMQRLHATVHDLGEAGEVLDRAHRDAGAGELARGAAGRDDLDAQLGEPLRELDDSALVGHRQQRSAHAHLARLGALDAPARSLGHDVASPAIGREPTHRWTRRRASARVLGIGAQRAAREQRDRRGSSSCSSGRSAASTSSGSRASGSSIARWRITGPVSTPASTKCTVTPNTFTP